MLTDADWFEVANFVDGRRYPLRFTKSIVAVFAEDGGVELQLEDKGRARITFDDSRTARIELPLGVAVQARGADQPFHLRPDGPGVYLHHFPEGPRESADLSDVPRTLRWNWRAPLGDLASGGAVASPMSSPGLDAWDSWKIAATLPTDLARAQIRAMFAHQHDDGMIPESVTRIAAENNRRNSKPPLAAWACSKHEGLLEEFREPLLRYLGWWENARRHPGSPFFSYGGTGDSEAAWESGWDGSTRFANAGMSAGRMTVLPVDLNAWMCQEKRLLGIEDPELERLVDETFFFDDAKGGAYYDVTWPEKERVPTLTAATWIPLWCGVASPSHANPVLRRMLDPTEFWTPLPFPSVSCADPRFDPDEGRSGAVWYDYAWWAVETLRAHGRAKEAREATARLLSASSDWECYHPQTGEPAQGTRPAVPQFATTAAARRALSAEH